MTSIFSTFHSTGAMILSIMSITGFGSEYNLCLFSGAYFLSDLLFEIIRKRTLFIIHHLFCIFCFYYQLTNTDTYEAKVASLAMLSELSTPFYHLQLITKNYSHSILFHKLFFISRIVWIPIMLIYLKINTESLPGSVTVMGVGFWVTNLFWYMKQIRVFQNKIYIK